METRMDSRKEKGNKGKESKEVNGKSKGRKKRRGNGIKSKLKAGKSKSLREGEEQSESEM